uniref:Uncharacterized protein n=1 Tax=Arundo donax TaxID=35708 RepID=A0A0A9DEL9_ARUDO
MYKYGKLLIWKTPFFCSFITNALKKSYRLLNSRITIFHALSCW